MTGNGLEKQRCPSAGPNFGLQIGLGGFSWTLQQIAGKEGRLRNIRFLLHFF